MAETGTTQFRQELTAHPRVLADVRRNIKTYLRQWGFEQLAESSALCVHELLCNVDKHTPSPECVLTVQRQPAGVRVGVSDFSKVLPVVREPDWIAESGRGLVVLNNMAYAWGAELTDSGKEVWAEFRASPRGRGANDIRDSAEPSQRPIGGYAAETLARAVARLRIRTPLHARGSA